MKQFIISCAQLEELVHADFCYNPWVALPSEAALCQEPLFTMEKMLF